MDKKRLDRIPIYGLSLKILSYVLSKGELEDLMELYMVGKALAKLNRVEIQRIEVEKVLQTRRKLMEAINAKFK